MEKSLVLLGGNKLHEGFKLKKSELDVNKLIVIDWNEYPDFGGDEHFQYDIKDYNQILNLNIDWNNVLFVYTSADIAVVSQVKLHQKMGLLTPNEKALDNVLTKGNSSKQWDKAGILNKYSQVLESYEEFTKYDGKKYIFKPNCSSGSRNITILEKDKLIPENVAIAFLHASKVSYDNKVIVEEFCEGIEFTVDMLGDNYGNVGVYGISKKYHTPYNQTNRIATKLHYCPLDISESELERIARFGQECYKALGLTNSFGHLEVICCEDGRIVPVEIGARSSGYIATHLLDIINNDSYLLKYADIIRGGTVKNGINFHEKNSSMYYFYDIFPGTSRCNTTIMEFLPSEIVSYSNDRSQLASKKHFPSVQADHERYGFEILGGDRDILTIENVNKAEKEFNQKFIEGVKL